VSTINNILNKLSNKHFLSLLGNGVIALFGLATVYVLCHNLSIPVVGKWFVFVSIISICDSIRNGFLGTAAVKFYAGLDEQRGNEILGSIWFLANAITLLGVLVAFVSMLYFRLIHEDELFNTTFWCLLTYLSSLPFSVIFWKLQADEQYGKMLWLRLVNSGSTLSAFMILAYLHQLTFESALLYNFLTNCLTSAVGMLTRMSGFKTIKHCKKTDIIEIAHYGKYSLATNLSSNLLRSSDTFIITAVINESAVAIYYLPQRLMEIIEIPMRSFVATGMSAMAVAYNKKDTVEVTEIMKKYAGMLTWAFVPVAIIGYFFAPLAVSLLGGAKYLHTEAVSIFRILLFISWLYPIDRFTGITLDIIHRPKINLYKVLIMLAVNIVGDFVLLSLFQNVYGAVITAFCIVLSGVLYGNYQLGKYLDYKTIDIIKVGWVQMQQLLSRKRVTS